MAMAFAHPHRLAVCSIRAFTFTSIRTAAPGFKGAPSVGKKRFRQPVCEDAEYLCKFVAGSNYMKTGEDVRIKDDSHYPDWLWTIPVGEPKLENYSPDTEEYWELLEKLGKVRLQRHTNNAPKETLVVGRKDKERRMYEERIKYRALASEETEENLGFRPEDYIPKYDKKLFLKPQESLHEEELVADEFAKNHPEKFIKVSRQYDPEPVYVRTKLMKRKTMTPLQSEDRSLPLFSSGIHLVKRDEQ